MEKTSQRIYCTILELAISSLIDIEIYFQTLDSATEKDVFNS